MIIMTIEELMQKVLEDKLNDGSIEKIISDKIDSMIARTVEDAFSWSSPAYKQMKEQVTSLMCKCIEMSDFNDYTVKINEVLNNCFKETSLVQYKTLKDSLSMLLGNDNDLKFGDKVNFNDIVDAYEKYLKEFYHDEKYQFNSEDIIYEDCQYADLGYSVIINETKSYWGLRDYEVILCNDKSGSNEETVVEFKLVRDRITNDYRISVNRDWKLSDLSSMNPIYIFLLKISQSYCTIELGDDFEEGTCDDYVTVEFGEE